CGAIDGLRRGRVPTFARVRGESEHRQKRLHEGRRIGLWLAVAVPAAIGPLPVNESLDQRVGAAVVDAERDHREEGVALLRGAAAIPPLHDRTPRCRYAAASVFASNSWK